jgi:NADH-quinone oxidoreductase subunit F
MEGKRGFPRLRPPYPVTSGLFGYPTAINNVETLSCVPHIFQEGHKAWREHGTQDSPGTKLFCLSGDVRQPGLYEMDFGVSLRDLVAQAGGMRGDEAIQAVLLGGAAGVFASPEQLDEPLTFENQSRSGLALGSGTVVVIDASRDLRTILLGIARFFNHESCGKCYPCQLGTQRQYEILQRLVEGRFMVGDLETLQDTAWTMQDASICGLGQTAATALMSAMRHWPELFSE